ncbi:MAG: hypothetical protein AABX11_07100 [Nanoarchaeota archaeon]
MKNTTLALIVSGALLAGTASLITNPQEIAERIKSASIKENGVSYIPEDQSIQIPAYQNIRGYGVSLERKTILGVPIKKRIYLLPHESTNKPIALEYSIGKGWSKKPDFIQESLDNKFNALWK